MVGSVAGSVVRSKESWGSRCLGEWPIIGELKLPGMPDYNNQSLHDGDQSQRPILFVSFVKTFVPFV